jgi:hypothetical protein
MRLLKLSLVFLVATAVCGFASQVMPASPDTPAAVLVPPHPLAELSNRVADSWFARGTLRLPNGAVFYGPDSDAYRRYVESKRNRRIDPDPKMNLAPRLAALPGAPCYKLRKFIVQPKEETWSNGVTPLGLAPVAGDWKIVGETDCTPSQKVWPKSAEGEKPPLPDVGFHSTVLRKK